MITAKRLEDLIRDNIPLGNVSNTGFYRLKCAVCNDYTDRAGFKFDGPTTGMSCFNCGAAFKYEEGCGALTKNARKILNAFGIDNSQIDATVNSSFFSLHKEESKITLEALTKVNTHAPTITLPPNTFRVGGINEFLEQQQSIVQYLIDRQIDIDKYQFYFSTDPRLLDRVIIPFYKNGNLIFWQARDITGLKKMRYDAAPVSKEAVLFGFNQLHSHSQSPLFVSEGVFDAMMFDGVATIGSKLNEAKIKLLDQCRRRLVFVIDKDKNGADLAMKVIEHGWEITFTPDGTSDLNDSVCRFGRTWTAFEIMKNIPKSVYESKLQISMRCK